MSTRTLYRDMAVLRAQGAVIEGEPSLGYVLKPGFLLPPLMFSEEELEAIVLGSRWVVARTTPRLAASARRALAKIAPVLIDDLRQTLDGTNLLIGSGLALAPETIDIIELRRAIRLEQKVRIRYLDKADAGTDRNIWPFAMGYFDQVRVLVA